MISKSTEIEVKLYSKQNGINVPRQLKEKMVSLVMLESRDFCTGDTFLCIQMAQKFESEYELHKNECLNTDLASFGPKYAFCSRKSLFLGLLCYLFTFCKSCNIIGMLGQVLGRGHSEKITSLITSE